MGNANKKVKKEDITKYYDVKEKLGTGSFATVKRCVRKADGKQFAVKIIKKAKLQPDELEAIHDEVDIMARVDHQGCVKLFEMFETPKKLYMVLELLSGGELFDRIVSKEYYSEAEAAAVMREVGTALVYLHSIGIVHRDLKPENLLYASKAPDASIKITDFGLAKDKSEADQMKTACGTPGYVAPEVLKNQPYSAAVDMWSVGVILYILLCGFPPFYSESTSALYRQIKRGDYEFPDPYWTDVSKEAKDLVTKLLTVDPRKRLTSKQMLQHKWLVGKASDKKFGGQYISQLAMHQARTKMWRGVQAVVALNRFVHILEEA